MIEIVIIVYIVDVELFEIGKCIEFEGINFYDGIVC